MPKFRPVNRGNEASLTDRLFEKKADQVQLVDDPFEYLKSKKNDLLNYESKLRQHNIEKEKYSQSDSWQRLTEAEQYQRKQFIPVDDQLSNISNSHSISRIHSEENISYRDTLSKDEMYSLIKECFSTFSSKENISSHESRMQEIEKQKNSRFANKKFGSESKEEWQEQQTNRVAEARTPGIVEKTSSFRLGVGFGGESSNSIRSLSFGSNEIEKLELERQASEQERRTEKLAIKRDGKTLSEIKKEDYVEWQRSKKEEPNHTYQSVGNDWMEKHLRDLENAY